MAALIRTNRVWSSRLKTLTKFQTLKHTLAEGGSQGRADERMTSDATTHRAPVDVSKWKKVDARIFGITGSRIPSPSWIVLKILRNEGFEAYLVGGCVRDLILNRIPKDFDVITTAKLKQIQKQFHNSQIVGRRFPICLVRIKGCVIEVSSFETVAPHAEHKKNVITCQLPRGCDEKDLIRWRDSLRRDFTINSLFLDPFGNKIYDYANGMEDLRSLKLQTLIPAQLSFEEDCARILRGLRFAARLNLAFSKDIESAICNLSSSIQSLDKSRKMLELNYMLSYGAAEPSLLLLWRFNLLKILLPFHAAYLDEQASKKYDQSSTMLMKLFFNMDKMVSCDRPSASSLWVGLLAFHVALVNNPQDALIVLAFASVLYHENWREGVKFARENAKMLINFVPEISGSSDYKSDEVLAKEVTQLAILVKESISPLTEPDSLFESMSRFPDFKCSDLVFVSKKTASFAVHILTVLLDDIESYKKGRESFDIDYELLGRGDLTETRFLLGKVILDTMTGVQNGYGDIVEEKNLPRGIEIEQSYLAPSDLTKHELVPKKDRKHHLSPSNPKVNQKRAKKESVLEHPIVHKKQEECPESVKKTMKGKHWISQDEATRNPLTVVDKYITTQNEVSGKKESHLIEPKVIKKKNKELNQNPVKKKGIPPSLSSLFK